MEPESVGSIYSAIMKSEHETSQVIRESPLCVFALSPPFQPLLATPRRRSNVGPDRRRSLPKTRPRFKRIRNNAPLLQYLIKSRRERPDDLHHQNHNLEDVLNTVRQAWKIPQSSTMDGGSRFRKISYTSSDKSSSPILLRRRLSAPEIVMRKHTLAQQRSDSQDSDATQVSDIRSCQFRNEFSLGSDSSLNRKRDSSFMRKSTLLRRFWSNTKQPTETFSVRSLGSTKSSPRTSPKHRMPSPNKLNNNPTTETDFDTTISLDNSDSAFSNSRSHFSGSTNSDIQKVVLGSSEISNQEENRNQTIKNSETQTLGTTNVNVISNVQLSKTTLDLIYKEVLKDVKDVVPDMININTLTVAPDPKRIEVQQVPNSFYLKENSGETEMTNTKQHNQMLKYMISNIDTGSSYSKPAELPQVVVPRFSAYPRTASMEVNASSVDTTDRESDTLSLVDSLEDPLSPHLDLSANRYDDKPVRGSISSLLPDNSDDTKIHKKTNKAFFIPIETDAELLEKAVSEHLPERVRERLSRRQMELKNKATSPRSDSNYVSSSDSHRLHVTAGDSSGNDRGNAKQRKRTKPFFPKIQTTRKIKIDSTRTSRSTRKQSNKTQNKTKSPLYTTKNEYHYDGIPNRIYHKTELNNANKRIEILEIMECIDVTPKKYSKGKSRIPVLVHQPKLPKINQQKPTFLEFQEVRIEDPKIDQLIANILIDTLNKIDNPDDATKVTRKVDDERKPSKYSNGNKYQQKFEVIPEEFLQTSTESNNNEATKNGNECVENNNVEEKTKGDSYKGKAALDNANAIPQGWMTFYMLQKSQGSPDSTSDEGKAEEKTAVSEEIKVVNAKENSDSSERSSQTDVDKKSNLVLPQLQRKCKRRTRNVQNPSNEQRGWTVTVSGSNTGGDFAPNLEMKLNFSQSNLQNDEEEAGKVSHISGNTCEVSSNENVPNSYRCKLPEINKKNPTTRKGRGVESREKPRQTKTSSTRMSLNRPKHQLPNLNFNENIIDFNSEERQLEEFLQRFPHFLSVTGNAIYQDRRPRIYAITESDIMKYTKQH